jgi:hypothetical protein
MATIKTIVDELNTIATAFTSVNTFIFDEIGEINNDVSKTYPAILVDSRSVNSVSEGFNSNYLPRKKTFSLKIYFLDTYKQAEKDTTDRQTQYAALETIADQFLAEVKRRTMTSSDHAGFEFQAGANGFTVDQVHNDNLAQVFYDITFVAKQICSTGTFAY